jgi:outer membrane protein assembly factor BamD
VTRPPVGPLGLVVGVSLLLGGCSSGARDDKLLEELANLDKETIFNRAEELYAEKEYEEARRLFSFVYDTFPNDPLGHKAALRTADSYAVRHDSVSLTEARLRYRDFANRYPNDPDRDYALLMVGHTYTARKLKPDRDLSSLEEALGAYQQLLTLYPKSRYAPEAANRITAVREVLAEHDWLVSSFYLRNKWWQGALWRLQYVKNNYPDYSRIDLVNEQIGMVEAKLAEQEEQTKKLLEELKKSDKQPS